jgi:hypothetical protein
MKRVMEKMSRRKKGTSGYFIKFRTKTTPNHIKKKPNMNFLHQTATLYLRKLKYFMWIFGTSKQNLSDSIAAQFSSTIYTSPPLIENTSSV